MIWACFSYIGVGPIHSIKGIMDKTVYVKIMGEVMFPYSEWNMPLKWIFKQDNDSRLAKDCFRENRVDGLPWPAHSLWGDVKTYVAEIPTPISKNFCNTLEVKIIKIFVLNIFIF